MEASENGKLDEVKSLVEKGANVNTEKYYNYPYRGPNEHIKHYYNPIGKSILVWDSYYMYVKDPRGLYQSPLSLASSQGHVEIVYYLLKHGANVHGGDDASLGWASRNGHIDVVELLLQNNADVYIYENVALRQAAENGHLDVVICLLYNGADIHAKDDDAYRVALSNGHSNVLRFLLDNGAYVNLSEEALIIKMSDILKRACKYGNAEELKSVLQKNIDIKVCGELALIEALIESSGNGRLELVKLLLQHFTNIHASDDKALRKASENGHFEVVKLLLDNGANIHAYYNTVIIEPSANGHFKVVKLLLENGASARDEAFIKACSNGHLNIVKLLFESCASAKNDDFTDAYSDHRLVIDRHGLYKHINIHSGDDKALISALENGHIDVVKFVLQKGFNIYKK